MSNTGILDGVKNHYEIYTEVLYYHTVLTPSNSYPVVVNLISQFGDIYNHLRDRSLGILVGIYFDYVN